MADNVPITAGSGTDIATDDVGSVHFQRVKLVDGTLDSTASIAGDATYGLDVDVTRVTGILTVAGNTSHDEAVGSTKPLIVGVSASTGLSGETLVNNDDVTVLHAGTDGALIVRPNCGLEDIVSNRITDTTGNSVAVISAQGSGIKTYLKAVAFYNSSTTNTYVDILDGATIKWTLPLPAYGGAAQTFDPPLVGTANTTWNVDGGTAVTTLYASYLGFKSKI